MENKPIDVIVIGELNVDLILSSMKAFPELGKEKLADDMKITLGSSSAIFASNLSSLGAKVTFLGKIGDDYFGNFIVDRLTEKGIDINYIVKDKNIKTGATVILNFDEERAMVTYKGAMDRFTINDIDFNVFSRAKHLHISSYFLQTGIKKDIRGVFKKAKDLGLTTSLDIQWDPEEKWDFDYSNILKYVDVFLPNEEEFLNLTNEKSVEEGLRKLSPVSNTITVKLGNKGSILINNNKVIQRESFSNPQIVDAIGAGDSFDAGFIFKYISGASIDQCQTFANLMGAINTTASGGTAAFTNYNDIMKTAELKFGYKFI